MAKKRSFPQPVIEAVLAAALLVSFFLPWLHSMGKPVAAHEIRALLEGPHRLLSMFDSGSRVSTDYRLSILLWGVPATAGCVLIAIGLKRYRAWMGLAAGATALVAFFFLKGEIAAFPFHRLAGGSYLAFAAGFGLAMAPIVRAAVR